MNLALNMKPISFLVEVRSYGGNRRHGKSVVRITQEKGAASSLKTVVTELTHILSALGIMVDDAREREFMESTFGSFRFYPPGH